MTSREIVQHTLDYTHPERVARSFIDSDFVETCCTAQTHATEWQQKSENKWFRFDEWGNTWSRLEATSKGEVIKGALEDITALESYEFPDYSRPEDYDVVRDLREKHPDKWLIGEMPGFAFNIARKMRKLDQYLTDLLLEKERMHKLHDRIDVMLEDMIRNYAVADVDSIMFPEDWGTQTQTMIHPDLWYDEFYPRFQKLCRFAHDFGINVFMHSCGKIEAIVPGLMRAGVDLLQFDQPDLHGIDILASHQKKGKITFWCPVDIQKTLQLKDETVIRTKVREMLDKLWQGRGGFVAGFYPDNVSIGLDPIWQDIASDEFDKYGKLINFR